MILTCTYLFFQSGLGFLQASPRRGRNVAHLLLHSLSCILPGLHLCSLLLSYSSSSSLQTQGTIEHIEWVNIFVESDVGLGEVQGERATWTSQGLCFRHVLPPVPIKMVRNLGVTTWHPSYRLLGD